jgi:hypothetical protein
VAHFYYNQIALKWLTFILSNTRASGVECPE